MMRSLRSLRSMWMHCHSALSIFLLAAFALPGVAAAQSNPNQGPGGPILVVTSSSAPFSKYYAEILRTEGLNEFNVVDVGSLSTSLLNQYDVVILGGVSVSTSQANSLDSWVNNGGNLIAMDPGSNLSSLLGITISGSTQANGYLLVDGSTAVGNGIVTQTMQYHGNAHLHTLNGATKIATLYSNATTATSNSAITLRNVGANGGQAVAFAYDLATSIVYTRQGNPAWATQERDGSAPIRSDDKFYGNSATDPKPNWIDLNKVSIPQADEQQRLLANLILFINGDKKPLPRFWYLPNGHRAVVLMTGDDHANGGTAGRFDQFKSLSPLGCSVANWECIRGTSYIFPNTPISDADMANYESQGFEISLHLNTDCQNYDAASLEDFYSTQLDSFTNHFPSLTAPATQRHHCIVWSDWATGAKVELNHGMRLDTSYYYWPPGWVNNVPGHFTGSAMPMRFADLDGTIIDVYQAVSQMTDESGQDYPFTPDTLLDRAIGPSEQYGVYTINAHTDLSQIPEATATVNSAIARGVPVITARQMLTWLDGRNSSSFGSISWNSSTLTFTVSPGTGSSGLQTLLPYRPGKRVLTSLKRNNVNVSYEVATVKGFDYAQFATTSGTYVATYITDTTAPTIASMLPAPGSTNVTIDRTVRAQFNEAMDPTSISASTFELRTSGGSLVASTISYDSSSQTAVLTPTALLANSTTFNVTVRGGTTDPRVKDVAGNALASNGTWSFTTVAPPGCPCTGWDDTATPANLADSDNTGIELGVKFKADINGFVKGVRFYKADTNTGTHIGNLWTSAGQLLASATFTNETASGWQTVTFATPVAITANTVYVASYYAPVGHYSSTSAYFATQGVDRGVLHLLQNGISGGNGLYQYGAASLFPASTFNANNYWVDVVYDTNGAGADTTPPTVVSKIPASGATSISIATAVTVQFSEPVLASTVNTGTFELRTSGGTLVPSTISYNTSTFVGTLTPIAPLSGGTTYNVTVRGGGTDPRVKDNVSNAMAANVTWSFTTQQNGVCPCTAFDGTTSPATLADPDNTGIELGVRFRSDVPGFIKGIRFYKGATNTGTHIGNLWSNTGTLMASATFTSETASGWQQVDFPTPIQIAANTVYVASYFAPLGHYSSTGSYFASTGVDRAPLHLPQNGVSGGNGLYGYGSSTLFPTSTHNSTNYWVDVVFDTTNGLPDTTPPTVVTRSPAANATNVPTATAVTAAFSEPLNSSTVTGSNFELRTAGGTLVPSTVTYASSTFTATLTPTSALALNTSYNVTLKGGATGIKDTAGNALAANVLWTFTTQVVNPCTLNAITAENCLAGNPASEWDISGAGDATIQGFATQISVNRGSTIQFKVDTNATGFRFDIYRMGYYGGSGARKIATVNPSVSLPQNQPDCLTQPSTGLIDCGNWAVSGSWTVPSNAVSGIYFAKVIRTDNGGASHIVFIVRNDSATSDMVFQTSDTTWQAYNNFGGNSLYQGSPGTGPSRAYKVSYNRPFNTRAVDGGQDWVFNAEYPMIRFLESNGYDVTYISGVDTERTASLVTSRKLFLSVGHDEYWSAQQRANVEAARAAGVHLAFFSGNEMFWKTRWENSIDSSNTAYRTLVSYKETHENAKLDPSPTWTGTWRDPRFSPPADGGRPENAVTGQIFQVNVGTSAIQVPAEDGKMRFWRNTNIATQAAGGVITLPQGTLGYEWDTDADNNFRPFGAFRLSSTVVPNVDVLQDYGSTYATDTGFHAMTLYRHSSGALVFGAGSVQWAWGLDAVHDRAGTPADSRMQQATINLFADMNVQPRTLIAGLTAATISTDTTRPVTTIVLPTPGSSLQRNAAQTVSGTASDVGGQVAGVEVSTDGGTTWHPATGRTSWSYTWTPTTLGSATVRARAVDDSGNRESPGVSVTVNITPNAVCPCTIWPASDVPTIVSDPDNTGIELGVKFTASTAGKITGVRFYKGITNTGTHVGNLWTASGTLLGTVTFSGESASGWQQANFAAPINITANTTYIVSYFAPVGHYSADGNYFGSGGVDRGPLHALADGVQGGNGLYKYNATSTFPTDSFNATNYWVDVVYTP